jgi:3',5'-cyclic AMP phosphodiesterase CpdA
VTLLVVRALLSTSLLALARSACGSPTTVLGQGARHPPAAPPAAPAVVRALHLADFGEQNPQQAAVAGAVVAAHRRRPFDLALFPGDNLYEDGPDPSFPGAAACRFAADGNTVAPGFTPPADPIFARHEAALAPLAGIPVHLALGNHDVIAPAGETATVGRLRACLEVAHTSPVWRMPARHYLVDRGPARFIVVDSNLVKGDYGGFSFDDEVAFVAQAAAGCGDRFCFLVGHHPPVTAGVHASDATAAYLARMARLVQAGGGRVRAWLAGHDHDLQHLRAPDGLDVLVSGNGSRGRPEERFETVSVPGAVLEFASGRWGYGVLSVSPQGWAYRFEDVDGRPLYCCAAPGTARCAPVQCG